jgi:hypothetical protein
VAQIVREQEFDHAILQDSEGRVIFNALQQDRIVVRRVYDDGELDMIDKKTGEVLLPKHDIDKGLPRCTHCGKVPY